jgi:hypothetical protein
LCALAFIMCSKSNPLVVFALDLMSTYEGEHMIFWSFAARPPYYLAQDSELCLLQILSDASGLWKELGGGKSLHREQVGLPCQSHTVFFLWNLHIIVSGGQTRRPEGRAELQVGWMAVPMCLCGHKVWCWACCKAAVPSCRRCGSWVQSIRFCLASLSSREPLISSVGVLA